MSAHPNIELHKGDLPPDLRFGTVLAIDTETMGLKPHRDRLCLAQMTDGSGTVHIVQFGPPPISAPNLKAVLEDPSTLKLFHYARFDIAALKYGIGAACAPVWCTKIASKLTRTYTDRHGLRDLVREVIGADMSKHQQSSDWGAETLSEAQLEYAASDVIYLHQLRSALEGVLVREGRLAIAEACFDFLPTRSALDLLDMGEEDIFAH